MAAFQRSLTAADRIRLQNKRPRPAEQDGPIIQAERRAFRERIGRVDVRRLVFLDDSGGNLAMGRSRAWVPRGSELAEPRPRNWGDNLTLVGAMRVDRCPDLEHCLGRNDDATVYRVSAAPRVSC